MDDLLEQGITAYNAGKRDEARNIFITVVKQNPDSESAWGWMYQASNNDQERIHCLKQILRINPKSEKAKQMLDTITGQEFPFETAQKVVSPIIQTHQAKPVRKVTSPIIQTHQNNAIPVAQTKKPAVSQKTPIPNQQKNTLIGCFAILAGIFVCVLLFAIFGSSQPNTPDKYLAEYGGNRDVYVEILALTDCKILQEKFDIASGNNARETPRTPQYEWTLGYMTASDDRMKEIGCYK